MSVPATTDAPSMIDWDLAVSLGARIAGDGPTVSAARAAAVVTELRDDANRSTGLVRDFTGLEAGEQTAPVLVVDRRGWIQANADGFKQIITPLAHKLTADKPPSALTRAVGSRITGAEVGGLLGFLASKVLGQFDPFFDPAGRLLLVAPNVVHVETELGVDPTDFRLWVCLHEETHRVQFTAVPWMREHLFSEVEALSATVEPTKLFEDGLGRVVEGVKNARNGDGSIVEMFSSPEQRALMDRVTGMMSLLEGHADVVMDGVGPQVIPSVEAIRKKFDHRRQGIGALDKVLRRLLGLDAKVAQYRDGAAFVRGVVDTVGMERFNAVWERPENLPTKTELGDHASWIARVL